MSTRAIQDPMQLLGFRDPVTDDVLAGGSVEFYGAGGSVAKNAWEDKDKASAITSVTLDSAGQAQVYLDGVYKFIVKNAAGTTKYTLDNLKFQARNTSTVTKTADYQATMDDDYILVDTDSGAVTITFAAVAGVVAPITVKNIGTSNNDVTIDGSDAETIDGSATATLLDNASQQYVTDNIQWYGAGISTGITFTSTTLVSGTNNSFDESSGITTINVPDASTTTKGAIEIATDAEVVTGTSEVLAVNPKQLNENNILIQHSVTTESTGASTSVIIPFDDTIPQITEGAEIFSVSFTPKLASSKVVVSVDSILSNAGNNNVTIALFKDAGADAICARGNENGASSQPLAIKHSLSPGATTAITFSVRFGGSDGTSTHIGATGAYYGAAATTTIEIIEIR